MTLRLTEEELAAIRQRGRKRDQAKPAQPEVPARGDRAIGPAGMNKTEARYMREKLAPALKSGEILNFEFESCKRLLSVNGERCWYTPDFEVMLKCGQIQYHEIKGGHITEDGSVKFLAAMRAYPMFHWIMWQFKGGEWLKVRDSRKRNRSAIF